MNIPGLSTALTDLRAIAEGMRILPELARSLRSIEALTESLDEEVRKMRQEVERVHVSVGELGDRLEPHVADMRRTLRPLERVTDRMSRRNRRQPDADQADAELEAIVDAADAADAGLDSSP